MNERRGEKRYCVRFLIRLELESEGVWHVVARDMSRTGAMFAASPKLKVGERVTLTFGVDPVGKQEYKVHARIVRFVPKAEDPVSLWPDQVAVEFEDPIPEIEELLKGAADLLERRYPSTSEAR